MGRNSLAFAERRSVADELLDDLARLENKPLDFALWAFPWGEPDTELEFMELEAWQIAVLRDLQLGLIDLTTAYRIAMKSGHDVGKSALLCIIVLWAFSTRKNTRGRVTANTEAQLRTTLWVELSKWYQLFIAKQFFTFTATRLCSSDPTLSDSWRIDAMQWSIDNPTAFAGLHNFNNRLIFIMDEAAKIPDIIWEVVDGTMREANTQLIWLVACQPIYNRGRFYECWNKFAPMWHTYTVDSRDVRMGNQEEIAAEIKARGGEEDDIVRIRIRGLFPSASALQFLGTELIKEARIRPASSQPWEPLILGIDIARMGGDDCVAQFRRGQEARSIPILRWRPKNELQATVESANIIASLIAQHSPDAIFIDATGYGHGVCDVVRSLGHPATDVNFGAAATYIHRGAKIANKRAEMYVRLKEWLIEGGCIPDSQALEDELLALQYGFQDNTGELKMMAKEDMRKLGIGSPDWADALALTFAFPVGARKFSGPALHKVDYDPLGPDALPSHDTPTQTPKFNPTRSCFYGYAERSESLH